MKHLAVRSLSMHGPRPFTATGLGDRIHCCTVAWCYGFPVTLHMTADKMRGGQFGNKPESWREVASLFPPGLDIMVHPVEGLCERDWMDYCGAPVWKYGDYPRNDPPGSVDVSPLLADIPRLTAEPQDVDLPDDFYTVQFDANGPGRAISGAARGAALGRFEGAPVVIGGEASGALRWSLRAIAWALSRARHHVGADSAFYHLARLYLPPERVYLCLGRAEGHHARRARDNGVRIL